MAETANPKSRPLNQPGWAPDGRAIVQFMAGACAQESEKPGIYLVDPATGQRMLVYAQDEPVDLLSDHGVCLVVEVVNE